MSKRRNRSNNDNVSQETLERARKQAAETASSAAEDDVEEAAPAEVVVAPAAPRARVNPSTRGAAAPRRSSAGQSIRKRKSDEKMTPETVARLLENPTKEVTEAELRANYTYVVSDLRNMGILAAVLMVALVVLAQVLPK